MALMTRVSLAVACLSASLVYLPSLWVGIAVFTDFYTPWVMFESELYEQYHQFLVGRLEERPEIPLQEIQASEMTRELVEEMTQMYTWPLVIRGLLKDSDGIDKWSRNDWWTNNYANESVLCGTLSEVVEDCTVGLFFKELDNGNPFYISGASQIFDKHHTLHDMIDNEKIQSIEPGDRYATQIFMGVPTMGSDIHCAIGVNLFRQIVGKKKWWFLPPSQTKYLYPSLNVNGFSSHTKTQVGKMGEEPSPWLNKLERHTTILEPGDVLINPPWIWHGIVNQGDSDSTELVVGAPSRYGQGVIAKKAGFKNNPFFMVNVFVTILRNHGLEALKPGFRINLQNDIANNRRDRENKDLVVEPVDLGAAVTSASDDL